MANMYCETAWFAGPPGAVKALKRVLTFESGHDTNFVEVHVNGEMLVRGWNVSLKETPVSLHIGAEMRWAPIGGCFYSISQAVQGLFMASCSSCVYDNCHLLVAGFDKGQHFRAEPPIFTDDWGPIRGISDKAGECGDLIELTYDGFNSAFEAAVQSFKRGHQIPRKALEIVAETGRRYQEFEPPSDSDFGEQMARLVGNLSEDD